MELTLPMPHIWVPRYLRREETRKEAGLISRGVVNNSLAVAHSDIVRAGGGGTFWSDTFTDADTTLITSHTGETGATYTKYGDWASSGDGLLKITDANRVMYATLDTINGETGVLASGTPAGAEYDITATFRRKSNSNSSIGLIARATYPSSVMRYYRIMYEANINKWTMSKVAGGATTSLGTYTSAYGADVDITVLFEIRDASKKLFLDGVERISSADNVITEVGKCGLYSGILNVSTNSTGIHIDTVTATDA